MTYILGERWTSIQAFKTWDEVEDFLYRNMVGLEPATDGDGFATRVGVGMFTAFAQWCIEGMDPEEDGADTLSRSVYGVRERFSDWMDVVYLGLGLFEPASQEAQDCLFGSLARVDVYSTDPDADYGRVMWG